MRVFPTFFPTIRRLALALAFLGTAATAVTLDAAHRPAAAQAAAQQQPERQTVLTIAAIVNDDAITLYDVQNRLAFLLMSSGLPNTQEVRQRLLPQVVSSLIDEKLRMQEVARLELEVTDQEVADAIANIERQRGMAPGTLLGELARAGVDPQTAFAQIRSEVGWYKVMEYDLSREVNVTDEEVEIILRRLRDNQGKPEHLVSEIFLPVALNSEEQVRALAERLVEELRKGAPFEAVARQFSQSPTAAVGGDLGWVHRGELEPQVDAQLAGLETGAISDPVRSLTGYHIITVRNRRTTAEPRPDFTVLTLDQITFPTVGPKAVPEADIAAHAERARMTASTCEDMATFAEELGVTGTIVTDEIYAGTLPDAIKQQVLSHPVEEVLGPIDLPGAKALVMTCSRTEDDGLPSARQVAGRLEQDKVSVVADQRLRDLRRQALIDVRL